jgi:hypothetical protein
VVLLPQSAEQLHEAVGEGRVNAWELESDSFQVSGCHSQPLLQCMGASLPNAPARQACDLSLNVSALAARTMPESTREMKYVPTMPTDNATPKASCARGAVGMQVFLVVNVLRSIAERQTVPFVPRMVGARMLCAVARCNHQSKLVTSPTIVALTLFASCK